MKFVITATILAVLAGIIVSCTHRTTLDTHNGVVGPLTVAEFIQSEENLVGITVRIRGFITPMGTVLFMHEAEGSPKEANTPHVLVHDTSPGEELSDPTSDLSLSCTNRYVEIEGVGGEVPLLYDYGISEIKKITIFDSNEYIGSGVVCYG